MVSLLLMVLVPMIIGIFGVAMIFGIVYNDKFQALAREKKHAKQIESNHPIVIAAMQAIMDLPTLEGTDKGYDVEEVALAVINVVWDLIEEDIRKEILQELEAVDNG